MQQGKKMFIESLVQQVICIFQNHRPPISAEALRTNYQVGNHITVQSMTDYQPLNPH